MTDKDALLRLDNQLCFLLYAGSRAITKKYRPLLENMGLTYPQYLVMLVLWENDRVPVKNLGKKLNLDTGTLTPLLKRLEAAGLIERKRTSVDERSVEINLTEKGHSLKSQAYSVPEELLCTSGISIDEFIKLKDQMKSLLDRLTENESDHCSEVNM